MSSASMFFIDSEFSWAVMSMDLAIALAALASSGLPLVPGTTLQVASLHGCIWSLALRLSQAPGTALTDPYSF